ncbi:hypothetical protein [Candidatus Poriferisodalis sp.]|uniref:hypothetical protein n=1 Tax=Candidatus Poriferisodalis sp. TaxID=3101277 RepID=UPI003D101EFE
MISKGQRGGKIAGPGNIGIQGCSWIFPDASVQEHAELSGNALIYGNAEVSGSAKIHGEARVSGDARISGNAEIYGKAIVSGNARVSGDTVVKGDALIAGDMNLESGIYDGKAEFKRAAQELYKANRDAIVSGLVACKSFADAFNNTHSQATQIAADLLAGKNTIDSALAPLILACKNLKVIKSIIDSFTGKKSKILTAISFALPVVGSLRLSPMLLHIVELGSAGLDVYMLGDAKVLHDRLAAEYNTILGAN